MNLKKLFLTAAMSLSLASCTMGGGTPSKNQLFHDVSDFLETRSVTIDGIPYIDSASDAAVIYSESIPGDDQYVPCFYFVIEGNVVNESLAALTAGEWTVPEKASEYGYECVNKQHTVEIDISYVETSDEANKIYAGTNYYVYAYADLNPNYNEGDGGDGGDTTSDVVVDNIIAFLKTRGVTVTSIPYFGDTKLTDVVYYEVEDGASGDYYPYFYVILEGDVVNAALSAFSAAGWTVPTQPDEEYGYECFNATKTVEIDILYVDPTDPVNEGIGGTSFCVYSYADFSSEGGDDGWDIDWSDPDAAVALAIATNIYGETDAEDNVGWFLFYYVMSTVSGNDIEAAVAVAARYLPNGFTQEGNTTVDTDTDEDTGESYEYASATFVNADGIIVGIETALSEEAGKIDVMYLIYADFDDEEDDGPSSQEGDANLVQNADGSYTATVDFSGLSDGALFKGQVVGDLTIGVEFEDEKAKEYPAYYTRGEALRIYHDTGLSFSVPTGHQILSVEFTCTDGNNNTVYVDDSNLTITGGTYTVNEKDVTITANPDVNKLVMMLNIGNKGNMAFTNISVTYK